MSAYKCPQCGKTMRLESLSPDMYACTCGCSLTIMKNGVCRYTDANGMRFTPATAKVDFGAIAEIEAQIDALRRK